MIKVTGLSKRYGTHLAVENVNFEIDTSTEGPF